jgi:cullin 1
MKVHQTMKNQLLIQEVTSQISRRFTPKIPDIKRVSFSPRSTCIKLTTHLRVSQAIATLLEKEYIERVGGGDTYAYVA